MMKSGVLIALPLLLAGACGTKDPPADCGSPDMAIVTLEADASDQEPNRWCVDIHAASRVDATATSPGLDEAYAVSKPGVYPWTNLTFLEASEACGRAGKTLCDWEVLKLITPTVGQGEGDSVKWDSTTVEAVPRNGPEASVPHRYDAVNPVDMVIRELTGKPPFPEAKASVAFFTFPPESAEDEVDGKAAYVSGAISGNKVAGGVAQTAPVPQKTFKHPLLGFRCCALAQLRDAFPPLTQGPPRLRPASDPEVPLAP